MKPFDEYQQAPLPAKNAIPIEKGDPCISNKASHKDFKPKPSSFSGVLKYYPRNKWIAEAAYFIAEHRNFAHGHALDDWLAAEQSYKKMLLGRFLEFAREDGEMTMTGLQQLAKGVGVNNIDKFYSKIDLICAIQTACNNAPCFKSLPQRGCEADCLWEQECQKLSARWQP